MAPGAQDEMAKYTEILRAHTSQQGIPVTELIVFKLKEPATDATTSVFESKIFANANKAKGLLKAAWGNSLSDPRTLIWMMNWDKIESHWEFWQTDDFLPVMEGISDLFVEGRPLVRHYRFDPTGFLESEWMRVIVFDQGTKCDAEKLLNEKTSAVGCKARKGGFAIDMGEDTWFCAMVTYDNKEQAEWYTVGSLEGVENHLVKLSFSFAI
ncbi:hypothetical protein G7Y89_g11384 [Cudoniella acicularis]|uniref:ABM domain-containing protein n=1 Tax=Cudoniella acicularis TaxID=354080 RepID=A0A8H4VYB8_9HELO|nr:hypothetical protein G7Y89_g11384 [Cudoniella acicularis]